MKQLIVLALFSFFVGCKPTQILSENSPGSEKEVSSVETTRKILFDLSTDDMQGRKPGSTGIEKAAAYIEGYLVSAGIKPYFKTSYKDTFMVKGTETYNIVGLIESENDTDEYILLGAHYDHIGMLPSSSDSVYNGANDNASGVTAVLEIAKKLRDTQLNKNIIVALFSGEEDGLLGSKHLAAKLKAENINLQYVINFEMIGKALSSGADKVYITGFDKSNFSKAVNQVLDREFVTYLEEENQYQLFYRSDNFPFYESFNIPAHTISTFDFRNYQYYHELQDEAEKLDPEHMHAIIQITTEAISGLLSENATIELTPAGNN